MKSEPFEYEHEQKKPTGRMRHAVIGVSIAICILGFILCAEVVIDYCVEVYGNKATIIGALFVMLSGIFYGVSKHSDGEGW